MCFDRYKNIAVTRLLPVFKYIKGQDIPETSKLGVYIQKHNSIEKIIANNIAKTLKNVPIFVEYGKLVEYVNNAENCRKAAMAVLKNINSLTLDELRELCKLLFRIFPGDCFSETNAKRCILCLDYMQYHK